MIITFLFDVDNGRRVWYHDDLSAPSPIPCARELLSLPGRNIVRLFTLRGTGERGTPGGNFRNFRASDDDAEAPRRPLLHRLPAKLFGGKRVNSRFRGAFSIRSRAGTYANRLLPPSGLTFFSQPPPPRNRPPRGIPSPRIFME